MPATAQPIKFVAVNEFRGTLRRISKEFRADNRKLGENRDENNRDWELYISEGSKELALLDGLKVLDRIEKDQSSSDAVFSAFASYLDSEYEKAVIQSENINPPNPALGRGTLVGLDVLKEQLSLVRRTREIASLDN